MSDRELWGSQKSDGAEGCKFLGLRDRKHRGCTAGEPCRDGGDSWVAMLWRQEEERPVH